MAGLRRLLHRRLGSYVNAAAALGASQLEAEAANHAGYVFEAPGVRGHSHLKHMVTLLHVPGTTPARGRNDRPAEARTSHGAT
jgi:hypothetical protein